MIFDRLTNDCWLTPSQPDVKTWKREFSVSKFNNRKFEKGKFGGETFHAGYFFR